MPILFWLATLRSKKGWQKTQWKLLENFFVNYDSNEQFVGRKKCSKCNFSNLVTHFLPLTKFSSRDWTKNIFYFWLIFNTISSKEIAIGFSKLSLQYYLSWVFVIYCIRLPFPHLEQVEVPAVLVPGAHILRQAEVGQTCKWLKS